MLRPSLQLIAFYLPENGHEMIINSAGWELDFRRAGASSWGFDRIRTTPLGVISTWPTSSLSNRGARLK